MAKSRLDTTGSIMLAADTGRDRAKIRLIIFQVEERSDSGSGFISLPYSFLISFSSFQWKYTSTRSPATAPAKAPRLAPAAAKSSPQGKNRLANKIMVTTRKICSTI